MKIKLFLTVSFIVTVLYPATAFSNYFSSPLAPGTEGRNKIISGVMGFGQNMQQGIAFVNCDTCVFQKGVAFGYTLGINYAEQLSSDDESIFYYFYLGSLLHLSNRNFTSAFRERAPQLFPEYDIVFPLMYKHTNTTSIMTAGLMPYISFNPFKYFFVKFGFDVSYVLSNNMQHQIELLDRRKTLPNGEVVDVFMPTANPNRRTYSRTVQDGEIQDVNKLQMSLVPAFGMNIYFTDRLFISPTFYYFKALNDISNFGENFRIDAWRASIELKYNLTTSSRIYIRRK